MSSILVKNLPPNINGDKLEIYFQKQKNGGGDVNEVRMIENGSQAIVVFEEKQIASKIVQREHTMLGKRIEVEQFEQPKKLFLKVEAILSSTTVEFLGEYKIELLTQHHKNTDCQKLQNGQMLIKTDSLEELLQFKKSLENLLKKSKTLHLSQSSSSPVKMQQTNYGFGEQPVFHPPNIERRTSVNSWDPVSQFSGSTRDPLLPELRDPLLPEWSDSPLPQPQDGNMFWQNVDVDGQAVIKGKFCFPEGEIFIFSDVIRYPSYDCIVRLPASSRGEIIKEMLKIAFEERKLFYVRKDVTGCGFVVQSAYDVFGSRNTGDEVDLSHKLDEIKSRLVDLKIPLPSLTITRPRETAPAVFSTYPAETGHEMMDTSPPIHQVKKVTPKPKGPFPQPDGLKINSELHEKSLSGFPLCEALHMYFRFPGGIINTNGGQTIQYVSYNRTACLPANAEGRKLSAMILEAANQRKLFVVALKAGIYMIRTKVPLLTSDDYPNEDYLNQLYRALLKLGISEPSVPPPLPATSEAHYEENSSDESDQESKETLRKGGPFPQPQNGVIRMERENRNLKNFGNCGTINIYFRFAGGKMKIEGSKPSKSFEVQYSQMYIVAALPDSENGLRMAIMLRTAFNDRKLFRIERREGEPSFRARPCVTLLRADEYSRTDYLAQLKKELKSLGIREPSSEAVASLSIPKSTIPQGGALPPDWAASSSAQALPDTMTAQPQLAPAFRPPGARPKTQKLIPNSVDPMNSQHRLARRPQTFDQYSRSMPRQKQMKGPRVLQHNDLQADDKKEDEEEDKCAICLAPISALPTKKLSCKHIFHANCVDMAIKTNPKCPMCNQPLGNSPQRPRHQTPQFSPLATQYAGSSSSLLLGSPNSRPRQYSANSQSRNAFGNQPTNGKMTDHTDPRSLPGYTGSGTIVIRYSFPSGIQQNCHPSPGSQYGSTNREAYLPDNREGRDLLKLLRRAFDAGLTFTIGQSQSSGEDNRIVWNGIPHKTNINGGKHSYGYPDPNYLIELRQTLQFMGIQ
uniref:uncharacterized protein LOC120348513 n=1 Tax=Styela clava TaxID=7725 RepID=UPI001939E2AD|nr:uncharacterized protein LOC120348513 [Styela clava]